MASLVSLTSCFQGSEDTSLVMLPDHFKEKEFSLSDIAEDLLIIPLSSDYPVYRFQSVAWHDSNFYYFSDHKIVRFSEGGTFIDELSRQGRGPEEYIGISDFLIHEATGDIYILDLRKIQVYDSNLNYQRTIRIPIGSIVIKMRMLNGYIHLFYFGYESNGLFWSMIDSTGSVLNSLPAVDLYESSALHERQIFENGNKLYRFYNRNDTIYEIDSSGARPYLLINRDFGDGFRLIKELTQSVTLEGATPYRYIQSIFGLGDYWLINFVKSNYPKSKTTEYETVLYSLKENVFYLISNTFSKPGLGGSVGIKNDWAGSGYYLPFNTLRIDKREYLLRVYEASEYISMVKNEEFQNGVPSRPEIKYRMISVANRLSNEDNPVLVLLKLKDE